MTGNTASAMSFFQDLAVSERPSKAEPSASERSSKRESVSEEISQRTARLHKQLSLLSIGSGVVKMCQDEMFDKLLHGAKPEEAGKLGSPPKARVPSLTGAFFSPGSSSKKVLDMSAQKNSESPEASSPLAPITRSRNGSTNSQKYIPPAQRARGGSAASQASASQGSEPARESDQARFKQWLEWDSSELSNRQRALIGKTVVGKLSPKRGNRYFVKWNVNSNDTIVIAADKVEEILGSNPPAGMWVSCTILGLGPGHVQWNKQHPYAMTLESRETRASHQPSKGKLPKNSPYWKKTQKAGLVRQVTKDVSRQTVPAEIDIARGPETPAPAVYKPPAVQAGLSRGSSLGSMLGGNPKPPLPASNTSTLERSDSNTSRVIPMPPPNLLPKGVILPQTVEQPSEPPVSLAKRTNGANINLVTGEVKARGRSDTVNSWRRDSRDRSFTV